MRDNFLGANVLTWTYEVNLVNCLGSLKNRFAVHAPCSRKMAGLDVSWKKILNFFNFSYLFFVHFWTFVDNYKSNFQQKNTGSYSCYSVRLFLLLLTSYSQTLFIRFAFEISSLNEVFILGLNILNN